jgi:hypothetical protein
VKILSQLVLHMIFWPKRRWISRFDAINSLKGFIRTRGNRAHGAMETVEKLGIIRGLVKSGGLVEKCV